VLFIHSFSSWICMYFCSATLSLPMRIYCFEIYVHFWSMGWEQSVGEIVIHRWDRWQSHKSFPVTRTPWFQPNVSITTSVIYRNNHELPLKNLKTFSTMLLLFRFIGYFLWWNIEIVCWEAG
jgi:hypothetical protein